LFTCCTGATSTGRTISRTLSDKKNNGSDVLLGEISGTIEEQPHTPTFLFVLVQHICSAAVAMVIGGTIDSQDDE